MPDRCLHIRAACRRDCAWTIPGARHRRASTPSTGRNGQYRRGPGHGQRPPSPPKSRPSDRDCDSAATTGWDRRRRCPRYSTRWRSRRSPASPARFPEDPAARRFRANWFAARDIHVSTIRAGWSCCSRSPTRQERGSRWAWRLRAMREPCRDAWLRQ